MHSPETSGFGLAAEQVGSWQQRHEHPYAGLPVCFARRGRLRGRVDDGFSFLPPFICEQGPEKMHGGGGNLCSQAGLGRRTEHRDFWTNPCATLPGGQGESRDFTRQ